MILSDRDIKDALLNQKIKIHPLPQFSKQLSSCSVDLQLGNYFRIYNESTLSIIDSKEPDAIEKVTSLHTVKDGDKFVIHPGEFALGITKERIEMPDDLTGRLEGRSSIGRMGIVIHSTAANIECGFRGNIVLELANIGRIPVALYPGMRICSITFEQLTTPAEVPYYKKSHAQYAGQRKP
jgi:dCTP deaminase